MLVDYSESEGSEAEDKPESSKVQKPSVNSAKPAFQKVVDRSNPHKIRVSLPDTAKDSVDAKEDEEGPPAKRAKVGGGAFGGFNSLLPAPKRAAAATTGGLNGTGAKRGGLGSGVNLKTGAAPGFSREPMPGSSPKNEEDEDTLDRDFSLKGMKDQTEDTSTQMIGTSKVSGPQSMEEPPEQPKKQGNVMMFKPLSVTRKPQKKKPGIPIGNAAHVQNHVEPIPAPPKPAAKVSLFSAGHAQDEPVNGTTSSCTYQPMIYGAQEPKNSATNATLSENPYMDNPVAAEEPIAQPDFAQGPQSLSSIASDLNLSASAKRQLLGRQNHNTSAINVVNFNTDQEYAANEMLRQAGEQVQHNPVRAIAPGKHSLKQLVNAASNQKDALEEQFASGRRNKKEAGSKYGW
ncbi:MAG: hypothetical protein LQ337_004121 [Flavoplaca oasis]|nr:MAG: hypothetical protein LQ337_004121 [Flavoplaca oasis]